MNSTRMNSLTLSNTNILYDSKFQTKLVTLAKKGNHEALELLINSISNFVYAIANQKAPKKDMVGDLAQEAFVSIITGGIPQYQESKKVPFRSYIVYWISAAMEKYLNTNLMNFPYHIPYTIGQEYRSNKQTPLTQELRNRKVISKLHNEEGEEVSIFDVIPDEDLNFRNLDKEQFYAKVEHNLKTIVKPKKQDIVFRYFCVGKYRGYPELSIKQLADIYKLSTQRMSVIIKNVLARIRAKYPKN